MAKKVIFFSFYLVFITLIFSKVGVGEFLSGQRVLYDFDAYYLLSQDVFAGINPYTVKHMQTLGPPLVLLFYLPFGLTDIEIARSLITLINLVLGFATVYLLAKMFWKGVHFAAFLILSLIYFSSFPFRFTLEMGQVGIVISFLVSLFLTTKKLKIKIAALSTVIILRTYFLYLVTALIKHKKILIQIVLTILTITIFSFLIIRPEWYSFYIKEKFVGVALSDSGFTGLNYYEQSLRSFTVRIGLTKYYWIIYISLFVYISFKVVKQQNVLGALVSSILLSPVSWQHYFVILFPIFLITFLKMPKTKTNLLLFFISVMFSSLEFPFLHQMHAGVVLGLLASHYFLAGVLLFYLTTTFRLKYFR